ncbi:hypothetical protein ACLOJK_028011 [Asimina triloba]
MGVNINSISSSQNFRLVSGAFSASFTLINNCAYTVWPSVQSTAGSAQISTTGFALLNGDSRTLAAPHSWSGRFWGRTHCSHDSSGNFSCATGDCGSRKIACDLGKGAAPPATTAEFTLSGANGLYFYDVSLVDGYNLPLSVVPQGGSGVCHISECVEDLNTGCPAELRVVGSDGGETVACKSACDAFRSPQYCCSGEYGNSNTCKPSSYSQYFERACPRAYSYAYDDKTSTFTCASADYVITFCPAVGLGRYDPSRSFLRSLP